MERVRVMLLMLAGFSAAYGKPLEFEGRPTVLEIRPAGFHAVRITMKPVDFADDVPRTPVLVDAPSPAPAIRIQELAEDAKGMEGSQAKQIGSLGVRVLPDPLQVIVTRGDGSKVQALAIGGDGKVAFALDDQPVLGMGEGGPAAPKDVDWHTLPVQFDRRGVLDPMEPHWQPQLYGSRNPVALLAGTNGWGLFFHVPWGAIDLTKTNEGQFLPVAPIDEPQARQSMSNQHLQLTKGLPPTRVRGLFDCFVFDAKDPAWLMKDLSTLSGQAAMPPKWALGYMQSHRTLETDKEMVAEVDTFREKHLPVDAVIYLGTGFTPRGWNKKQPSFDFNPEVFKRDPVQVIDDMHQRHVKVALHMVPWDRDKLPALQGTIPPQAGETLDASHILNYWKQHEGLVKTGVDAWWPDEGDWFDLYERMKRHEMYYTGPLSTQPDKRPWSLHRNGYLGIAKWGGWVWSGDTDSSWKTLEAQIAVGINHSLSIGPYWGSDLGGFTSHAELTGELYARWFQFAVFCPSFRAHGRTWWTRLPWGWGLKQLGPVEDKEPPLVSELDNPEIEKIARRYDELRYQLLSYNYTLSWEARETGMPFMRALWLHAPDEPALRGVGDEFLWGRNLLIAPVYTKGATDRSIKLPKGLWYDFWTGQTQQGGQTINQAIDLATMPIYVRAGTILPLDPVRQYTSEMVKDPLTFRIFGGDDGDYTLYEDDGESMAYLKGGYHLTHFEWKDAAKTLSIRDISKTPAKRAELKWKIQFGKETKEIVFGGAPVEVKF